MFLTCGATETRTPDLLHAMERRTVHHSPRPFTRDRPELAFRPEQVTCVHQSSLRTVTSLVTSPPRHYRRLPHRNNIRIIASCRTDPLSCEQPGRGLSPAISMGPP